MNYEEGKNRTSWLSCGSIILSIQVHLLPTGSEEREVLGVGSIPVAILPSRQDIKYIAL